MLNFNSESLIAEWNQNSPSVLANRLVKLDVYEMTLFGERFDNLTSNFTLKIAPLTYEKVSSGVKKNILL